MDKKFKVRVVDQGATVRVDIGEGKSSLLYLDTGESPSELAQLIAEFIESLLEEMASE